MMNLTMCELNENEIQTVSGGNPIVVGIVAVAAVATACNAIESCGEKVGKAIYILLH